MINGETLRQAIISGANNISSIKARINDLNIFPVPDGDTGTNMSMTIVAAADALKDAEPADVSAVARMTASARQLRRYHLAVVQRYLQGP